MGSLRFEGILFAAYPMDHDPPHVHAYYAEVQVIVELLPNGEVEIAKRRDAVRPREHKQSDVQRVLRCAKAHLAELMKAWEEAHG